VRTLRTLDSPLQGHPDRTRCEFVDVSTGALGQGLSVALGRAQGRALRGSGGHVYCMVGDGECQEGQIWEAAMYAGVRRISNITLVIDSNGRQSDGTVDETVALGPLADKFWSFRWMVQEVDGHSHRALRTALAAARRNETGPCVIIAHTRKGYLGPGRSVLNGAHGGLLEPAELRTALDYLEVTR
jgi:transketolase